ncbi:MAG: gliding motility protein GldM [Ferruginibacter sp.]|nr:gliding motility protein GldM [Ferruginibacter sp.]
MALPKEPRQKMINIMYLVLTALLALNVSAEVIEAFRTVDKSLLKSNANIESSNEGLFKSLAAKVSEPGVDKAKLAKWTANAETAKKLSDEFNTYIEGLKKELKTASGLKLKDGVEEFKMDDLNASSRLMDNQKKGKELDDKLKAYRAAMLAIDPELEAEFKNTFPVEVDATKDATTGSFRMMPTVAAVTLLSKFQNNVKNAENQIVAACHSKIGQVKFIYDKFAAVVGQSSNYVMPGEKVKITAGVGAFSTQAQPQITIGGSGAAVNADGVAEREFTADGGGNKSVPVTVTYTKPDGTKESKSYTIEYTVGTPGGAAVMLDKMNVFYIGVDNPITIGSPTGWDKTNVSMSGGTISGTGSKRTVRVSAPGAASITVTADGKPSTFSFRVKRIPDPTIMVGPSGGGKMQTVVFQNQQFVRADLKEFDFEASYRIVSATIYFTIPGVRNNPPVTISSGNLAGIAQMKQLVPGSSVTFDNIKVVGPDGQQRTIQNPPGFALF